MTRSPPRLPFPRLSSPQRSFRKPPVPGMTSPAAGCAARNAWSVAYSSSVKYADRWRVNAGASKNSAFARVYASCVAYASRVGNAARFACTTPATRRPQFAVKDRFDSERRAQSKRRWIASAISGHFAGAYADRFHCEM